jgi:hypothetical protein
MHEVFGRVGNMQARKTGHGKIDKKKIVVCRAHEKINLTRNLHACQGKIARLCEDLLSCVYRMFLNLYLTAS